MKYISFVGSSIFQILSLLFVLGFLFGILNIHFSDKNDYCVMTYMFEYPQFVRVTVPENKIFPQYGLYAYSEGRFTERARKMWFDGVPVLFLPGNCGSHMQARSYASVALRKALGGPQEFHFDYFTIDYNEELSGLYGGVLESQTQFAAACIARILSLYKSNRYTKNVPTSVVLIGHSMTSGYNVFRDKYYTMWRDLGLAPTSNRSVNVNGGVIAKRLLAYPSTTNSTSIAITLAAPLEAPVVNFDYTINDYYTQMNTEWNQLAKDPVKNETKILLSFGNGPRDVLIPSGLTSSKDSYISALVTAIPGVWVSPDHVAIVWCKQLVMAVNRYLFDVVDPQTEQISENRQVLTAKARQYFQANRSMTLSPEINRPVVSMVADAFWYEDNRRIYQIARPEIDKTTYLMIRLVNYPQNRFVAVESVNVSDKDWLFGCNAMYTYNTYRYCKQATSLTELSRWSGAATDFGKRKLATIHLHSIKEQHPDWTHVVVKVSPTRKPITLNVDINDYVSRQITVDLPSVLSFTATTIIQETEPGSVYYSVALRGLRAVHQAYLLYVEPSAGCQSRYHVSAELHVPWADNNKIILNVDINDHVSRQITVDLPSVLSFTATTIIQETEPGSVYYSLSLRGLSAVHQAYLLYVEPSAGCKSRYHVSAELHVPWAPNNEYYHYFTHTKHSPMKLRLYKSNPNITYGLEPTEHVKVTLLLDPQCTFSISISSTWYHRLAQIARNYVPVLTPYMAAVLLLAARSNILSLKETGKCITIHSALMSEGVKPYYVLVCARLGLMLVTSVPLLTYIFENASWANTELMQFSRSLLVIPAYMTALGIMHIIAAAVVGVMVFSSQLAHRLFFRIVWRGGSTMAERVAAGLQKMPYIVIVVLIAGVPLSCGAASLVAGAAFYAFILSRMYEDYLEDYVYKLMAKIAAKMCRLFTAKKPTKSTSETNLVPKEDTQEESSDVKAIEEKKDEIKAIEDSKNEKDKDKSKEVAIVDKKDIRNDDVTASSSTEVVVKEKEDKNKPKCGGRRKSGDLDEDFNNLNFHMMMFSMWTCVTLVNVPALLTWARNFKYSMVLKPDTSYHVGLIMSVCSACLWQMSGPRRNLKHYDAVVALLFVTAVFIIVLGPFSLSIVNYSVTFIFFIITLQQLLDKSESSDSDDNSAPDESDNRNSDVTSETDKSENVSSDNSNPKESGDSEKAPNESTEENKPSGSDANETNEDCACNEGRIYTMFKNLRDKFDFSGES